jgi:hypothetical protein
MKKILEKFFEHNFVKVPKTTDFFKTDLCNYLELAYGAKAIFSNKGFIKVIEKDDCIIFSEHLFYDYFPNEEGKFISIEGLEISSTQINNSDMGKSLSRNGYFISNNINKELRATLLMMSSLNFSEVKDSPVNEPFATFKYNPRIWQSPDSNQMKGLGLAFYEGLSSSLNHLVQFSDVLKSLNCFDLNVLEWKKGLKMDAHNGVDYKSFINLITYNTEHSSSSRTLEFGSFDWKDLTLDCLKKNNYENLMAIDCNNNLLYEHLVNTNSLVLVNAFNPRFYHQVSEFKGDGSLFVCTANKSFKSITQRFDFNW